MMEYRRVAQELHAPARRRYPRRRVVIKGFNDLFQADLVDMNNYPDKGFKYILTVIDCYSKYLWAVPVKTKNGSDVTAAMTGVLRERAPKNLQTDRGTEFYNSQFKALMRRHNINHYSTYSNLKASIVERVNRTLKEIMWRDFTARGNYKWVEVLPELVKEYNGRRHRTTGMKPRDVTPKTKLSAYDHMKRTAPIHFKVGDKVRVSKLKSPLEKGYTPNWSTEIFTVCEVRRTNPTTYHLKDERGVVLAGGFYREELRKTLLPDVFLVEKILKRKAGKVYVKWLGFSKDHNSWIDANKIIDR